MFLISRGKYLSLRKTSKIQKDHFILQLFVTPPFVQLDPIEKEWIYSAAGARVPDLSQLLRQDPTLANKKVAFTPEEMFLWCFTSTGDTLELR